MAHEKLLSEFVERLKQAAGDNLISVILYGSAAEGEFHPEYSDLNLLCVLRDTSFASLSKIASAVEWWRKKKYHPPLVLTPQELKDTADVFSIEFVDMKQRHRVLYGEDVLRNLDVPMHLHRSQLEYELREKLISVAAAYIGGGNPGKRLMGSHAQFIVVIHNPVSACVDRIGRAGQEAFAGCGPGAGIAAELRFVRLRTINGRSGKEV